ncbi:MAG: 2'-5' RNA ligase family protein, partial [Chloroflexota bacterium]
MLRLFFAVPVSDEARARVGALIDAVQGSVGDGSARIRWVRVDGLHLTLRFLGPTPEDRRPPLEAAADAIAASVAPFEVGLAGGGAFPSLARPRSLWI